jgi:AraC family transcriptional activator of pobA
MIDKNSLINLGDLQRAGYGWGDVIGCKQITGDMIQLNRGKMINDNYYLILLCQQGCCRLAYDDREYDLHADSFCFRCPFSPATLIDASDDFRAVLLVIDSEYYEQAIGVDLQSAMVEGEASKAPFYIYQLSHSRAQRLMEYYTQVSEVIHHDHFHKDEMIRHLVYVFHLIIYELLTGHVEENTDMGHKENIYRVFVFTARKHFREHRQLKFYADRQNITTTYLSRVIKDRTGNTAYSYIETLLYNEIRKLLRNTDFPVSEIAFRLHFNEQSALTNFFKLHAGMSPSEYRASSLPPPSGNLNPSNSERRI